jgi:hypothetical protein
MAGIKHQHQCSSEVLVYNGSIFYKLRQTYLIIDIEPRVDHTQRSNDQSYYSLIKDYIPYSK